MQHPDQDKAKRRAELALRVWKVIHALFVVAMGLSLASVIVMFALAVTGWRSFDSLHDAFIGAVVALCICVVCATLTIVPVERLKRRVNRLTYESEG